MAASLLKKVPHCWWTILCRSKMERSFLSRCISDFSKNGVGETDSSSSQTDPEQSPLAQPTPTEDALRKFDRVVEKVKLQHTSSLDVSEKEDEKSIGSFATMLRHSKVIALGEEKGKRVTGKIIEVMHDDLYIDFGGKFHCVCPRPQKNGELYQRGAEVIVSLKSQEMSSAFLGSPLHLSLLEADAILLGLRSKPESSKRS